MSERWSPKQIKRELVARRGGDTSSSRVFGRYEHVPAPGETQAEDPRQAARDPVPRSQLLCRTHNQPWQSCLACSTPKKKA